MQNPLLLQSFHWYTPADGQFYTHLAEQVDRLKDLGVTMVWLPPAYKGASGGYSVGYDPYDLFDLGEFDQKGSVATKYGTREELLHATTTLQQNGIAVMVDIVLNHKAGGDELEKFMAVKVNPENRQENLSEPYEIESYTRFTFPGRAGRYSDFEWNFTCFSGVDFAEGEEGQNIYQIINEHGPGWEETISREKGNFDYLMYNDVDHRNPFVRQELNRWAVWYHEQLYFDGVRLDAVKHQSPQFYQEWLYDLRMNTGKNIFAVGEYWAPGRVDLLQKYIEATMGSMSLFDSALHGNFHQASQQGGDYDLRTILNETLVSANPALAVTVADNHDTQPLQALEAPVQHWFKPHAHALMLLRQDGLPCLFWPDVFGAHYSDKGRDGNDYEIFLEATEGIENLLKARLDNAYGVQRDYFENPNFIGWTREGDDERAGLAVVMSNRDAAQIQMYIGERYAGQTFRDALGKVEEKMAIGEDGQGDFKCAAGSVSVWVPEV